MIQPVVHAAGVLLAFSGQFLGGVPQAKILRTFGANSSANDRKRAVAQSDMPQVGE